MNVDNVVLAKKKDGKKGSTEVAPTKKAPSHYWLSA